MLRNLLAIDMHRRSRLWLDIKCGDSDICRINPALQNANLVYLEIFDGTCVDFSIAIHPLPCSFLRLFVRYSRIVCAIY
jgi:hypothetical protein